VSMVPAQWRLLYHLNPVVGVIEGFRWAVLGKQPPDVLFLAVNVVTVCVVLWGGLVYFKRTEQTFTDVI
jgi:lipopolysaccharide transport system permease protein